MCIVSAYSAIIHIRFKFHEIPFSGYLVTAPDGHGQNYIPPPLAGDNKKCSKKRLLMCGILLSSSNTIVTALFD